MEPYEEPSPMNPPAMAPPSDVGQPYISGRASNWPSTIGIILIVFSVLAVMAGAWGAAVQIFSNGNVYVDSNGQQIEMQMPRSWQFWAIADQLTRIALGIMAIVAGAKLIGRSSQGIRLARTWATLKTLICIVGMIVLFLTVDKQLTVMNEVLAQSSAPISPDMLRLFFQVIVVLWTLWGVLLPLIVLIWFARNKIKAEVATWDAPVPPRAYPPTGI